MHRKNCYHLEYARNGAENKEMEKRMVLPTQAFLEDIGLSEEVGSEDGQEVYVEDEEVPEEQALNSQGCRPHTPRQATIWDVFETFCFGQELFVVYMYTV